MVAADELKVGDLVQKIHGPREGCLAIVTDLSMEKYFQFIAWIRIVYVDDLGGYEWIQRHGLRIVVDKVQR
jgi:hypothetical protein|tara:strand:+ start:883 stop:1095 length:213 start_codon:yes stop_codon:yes gene_type:complete